MKAKVKAFTILEVSISMLIAAIVIGIAYSAYNILSHSYLEYNKKKQETGVVLQLNQLLKKDFIKSDLILDDQGIVVFRNNGDIIRYEFTPDYVIRTSQIIDTFKVKSQQLNLSFEGQPVDLTNEDAIRIDEADFTVLFENRLIPYHYYKQYSSVNLMQITPNAIN
jgi:prepilin-type N-terminal cleavage/methylation domain-containing protein